MKIIILDSGIFVWDPQLIGRSKAGITFVLPAGALHEAYALAQSNKPQRKSIPDLLNHAIQKKTLIIEAASELETKTSFCSEDEIISIARKFKKKYADVCIASNDRMVQELAKTEGIPTITFAQLAEELRKDTVVDQVADRLAQRVVHDQKLYFWRGVLGGILFSLFCIILWTQRVTILKTVNAWGTCILILVFAIFLYWFRSRQRLPYAITEIVIGYIMAVRVLFPAFHYADINMVSLLQITAGLYVMVRGQDNLFIALQGTKFGAYWKEFLEK